MSLFHEIHHLSKSKDLYDPTDSWYIGAFGCGVHVAAFTRDAPAYLLSIVHQTSKFIKSKN